MNKIVDFNCTFDDGGGVPVSVMEKYNLVFPDCYKTSDGMVTIAKGIKEEKGVEYTMVPFCHTVEAEAFGGDINLGNEVAGPRAKSYVFNSLEELEELKDIDFSSGRIAETLKAIKKLSNQGEKPIMMINGPFSILNALIDPKHIFKGMRKTPEKIYKIFEIIKRNLIQYIKLGNENGARLFSYADSAGSVKILGPKMAEDVVNNFTYPFLKEVEMTDDSSMLLCPKTVFALLGTDLAKWEEKDIDGEMTFAEAVVSNTGKFRFAGEMCIKNVGFKLKNGKMREVVLK